MQIMMALTTALSSAGSWFNSLNVTTQRSDYTPLLTCIDEIQGVLDGIQYNQPSSVVECGRSVTYCQKITAHYISTNSETEIEMRGCDPIQVEDRFDGVPCMKEGCHEQVIDSETYNVCCCASSMCNFVPPPELLNYFLGLGLLYVIRLL
ncbi:hypothetical protein OESDEN_16684 [Oesophagostomum dentatum]|uniref:ET module n=1 Tax=Oesophagostomum dentatum TaxID=61180 RepID=A0A0B1SK98_OESDE|nr:hypothetical protein OESDEN_16684 [Oesophagostomum dentatum]